MSDYKNPTPTVDCIIELPVYIGRAQGEPKGSDDASEARTFKLDALPKALCFDHGTILSDSLAYKRTGQRRKI